MSEDVRAKSSELSIVEILAEHSRQVARNGHFYCDACEAPDAIGCMDWPCLPYLLALRVEQAERAGAVKALREVANGWSEAMTPNSLRAIANLYEMNRIDL